jgi:hypothetical protein
MLKKEKREREREKERKWKIKEQLDQRYLLKYPQSLPVQVLEV